MVKWNKRVFLLLTVLLVILGMAACQSPKASPPETAQLTLASEPVTEPETSSVGEAEAGTETAVPPVPEPGNTAEPAPEFNVIETLSADIDQAGEALTSADGAVELVFPPDALPEIPPCYRYVGAEVVVNKEYMEKMSTVPADRQPQKTDLVHIQAETTVVDKVAKCDVIVAHVFEPAVCAPATITVTVGTPPHVYDYDFYASVYFPPESNLSAADRAFLSSISIMPPTESERGNLAIALPLGTEVNTEGDQATITVPQEE